MAKDEDDTSVQTFIQKLTKVYVNTFKKLTRVICLITNLKKLKNLKIIKN
jgi:hypothetical protein